MSTEQKPKVKLPVRKKLKAEVLAEIDLVFQEEEEQAEVENEETFARNLVLSGPIGRKGGKTYRLCRIDCNKGYARRRS
jgi:hypothetical protein